MSGASKRSASGRGRGTQTPTQVDSPAHGHHFFVKQPWHTPVRCKRCLAWSILARPILPTGPNQTMFNWVLNRYENNRIHSPWFPLAENQVWSGFFPKPRAPQTLHTPTSTSERHCQATTQSLTLMCDNFPELSLVCTGDPTIP